MPQFDVEEFRFPCDPEDGSLTLCAKRYRPIDSHKTFVDSVTLLLTHCAGAHKEQWEPTLAHLFNLQSTKNGRHVSEAWSLEVPNHGESAIINENAFLKRPQGISAYCWARGCRILLLSGRISSKNVVAVGHSAGVAVLILSTMSFPLSKLPYRSMILVEPPMMSREVFARAFRESSWLATVIAASAKRRDIWPSRLDAMAWFKARHPWKTWDAHVLQSFVDYGLRDLPTGTYPDKHQGVTLSCPKAQETASYAYHDDGFDSLERLSQLCSSLPVHCIFGSRIDVVSEETYADILDVTRGRKMASISKVDGAGHAVPKEAPSGLASVIFDVLQKPDRYQSRL